MMRYRLVNACCVDYLQENRRELRDTIDLCVTDGPYHMEATLKRFGKAGSANAGFARDGMFARSSERFVGQQWDTKVCFEAATWRAILNALKPGAFCFAFAASDIGHRQACAMEDAGFVMYPFFAWAYATGAPKPHPVGDGSYFGKRAMRIALEPIYVGQKPLSERTFKANIDRWGTGALQIANYRRRAQTEKWPTTLFLDGSEAVDALFSSPDTFCRLMPCKKAGDDDRGDSNHPTAKPIELLQRLISLGTLPGGIVLDAFAGSGTTGVAAIREDCEPVLIEQDPTYFAALQTRFRRLERRVII